MVFAADARFDVVDPDFTATMRQRRTDPTER
jgi:hypothetical protein